MTKLDKLIKEKAPELLDKLYAKARSGEILYLDITDIDTFKAGATFALTPEVLIHVDEVKALVDALDYMITHYPVLYTSTGFDNCKKALTTWNAKHGGGE